MMPEKGHAEWCRNTKASIQRLRRHNKEAQGVAVAERAEKKKVQAALTKAEACIARLKEALEKARQRFGAVGYICNENYYRTESSDMLEIAQILGDGEREIAVALKDAD